LPVTLTRDQALCVLLLEEEIDIRCAAELKQGLVDALAAGTGLQIDFARATQVDITAIQLLWAAQREAERKGVALAAAGPVPERIRVELREAGFEKLLFVAATGPDQAMGSPANVPKKIPEEASETESLHEHHR
jgi:anti-anti-sigma regulatory factor